MKKLGFVVLLGVAIIMMAAAQRAGVHDDHNSGATLYRTFCASCHGPAGNGDGPVADLGPPPPNLTLLSQRNGGVFPRDEVRARLEGARTHGYERRAMPNWRDVLRKAEHADDRTIAARLEALVAHVESLQK